MLLSSNPICILDNMFPCFMISSAINVWSSVLLSSVFCTDVCVSPFNIQTLDSYWFWCAGNPARNDMACYQQISGEEANRDWIIIWCSLRIIWRGILLSSMECLSVLQTLWMWEAVLILLSTISCVAVGFVQDFNSLHCAALSKMCSEKVKEQNKEHLIQILDQV